MQSNNNTDIHVCNRTGYAVMDGSSPQSRAVRAPWLITPGTRRAVKRIIGANPHDAPSLLCLVMAKGNYSPARLGLKLIDILFHGKRGNDIAGTNGEQWHDSFPIMLLMIVNIQWLR